MKFIYITAAILALNLDISNAGIRQYDKATGTNVAPDKIQAIKPQEIPKQKQQAKPIRSIKDINPNVYGKNLIKPEQKKSAHKEALSKTPKQSLGKVLAFLRSTEAGTNKFNYTLAEIAKIEGLEFYSYLLPNTEEEKAILKNPPKSFLRKLKNRPKVWDKYIGNELIGKFQRLAYKVSGKAPVKISQTEGDEGPTLPPLYIDEDHQISSKFNLTKFPVLIYLTPDKKVIKYDLPQGMETFYRHLRKTIYQNQSAVSKFDLPE